MKLLFAFALYAISCTILVAANRSSKQTPRLPPAIGGGQTGYMDVGRLPTAIQINGRFVLPRGGTIEKLLAQGFVPSPTNPNVFVPNLNDKRYKPHRRFYYMAPLVTGVSGDLLPIGMTRRQPSFRDPFAGIANPLIPKYTPIPGTGVNPGAVNPNAVPGGPFLLPPGAPGLENSPFAPGIGAPGQVAPGLAPRVAPQAPGPQPAPATDPNDPFANEPVDPTGKKINPLSPNLVPADQDRLRRQFLDRQQQRLEKERQIRELQRPVPAPAPAPGAAQPARGIGAGPGLA
ncbi:MAG: hypothetical protein VCA18_01630 [Opitutales bacterium]